MSQNQASDEEPTFCRPGRIALSTLPCFDAQIRLKNKHKQTNQKIILVNCHMCYYTQFYNKIVKDTGAAWRWASHHETAQDKQSKCMLWDDVHIKMSNSLSWKDTPSLNLNQCLWFVACQLLNGLFVSWNISQHVLFYTQHSWSICKSRCWRLTFHVSQ